MLYNLLSDNTDTEHRVRMQTASFQPQVIPARLSKLEFLQDGFFICNSGCMKSMSHHNYLFETAVDPA